MCFGRIITPTFDTIGAKQTSVLSHKASLKTFKKTYWTVGCRADSLLSQWFVCGMVLSFSSVIKIVSSKVIKILDVGITQECLMIGSDYPFILRLTLFTGLPSVCWWWAGDRRLGGVMGLWLMCREHRITVKEDILFHLLWLTESIHSTHIHNPTPILWLLQYFEFSWKLRSTQTHESCTGPDGLYSTNSWEGKMGWTVMLTWKLFAKCKRLQWRIISNYRMIHKD